MGAKQPAHMWGGGAASFRIKRPAPSASSAACCAKAGTVLISITARNTYVRLMLSFLCGLIISSVCDERSVSSTPGKAPCQNTTPFRSHMDQKDAIVLVLLPVPWQEDALVRLPSVARPLAYSPLSRIVSRGFRSRPRQPVWPHVCHRLARDRGHHRRHRK